MKKENLLDKVEEFLNNLDDDSVFDFMENEEEDNMMIESLALFYHCKIAIVNEDYEELKNCFDIQDFFIHNYINLLILLNDEDFRKAYPNLKDVVYLYISKARTIVASLDDIKEDEHKYLNDLLNDLIIMTNGLFIGEEDLDSMLHLKKLIIREGYSIKEILKSVISNNPNYLDYQYDDILQTQNAIFYIYYVLKDNKEFQTESLINQAMPYLTRFEELSKEYNETFTRIREI